MMRAARKRSITKLAVGEMKRGGTKKMKKLRVGGHTYMTFAKGGGGGENPQKADERREVE